MKSTRKRLPLLAALTLTLASLPGEHTAHAGSATAALSIGASVDIRCTILTSALMFGDYLVLGLHATTPLDGVGNIHLNCSQGGSIDVRLGQGSFPAPGSTNAIPRRRMGFGGQRLGYNLYEDAARTTVWDNVPKGLKGGKIFPLDMPVYGRIPAGQMVPAGRYVDSVVATISF